MSWLMIPRQLGMQRNAAMYSNANVWMQTFDCCCIACSLTSEAHSCSTTATTGPTHVQRGKQTKSAWMFNCAVKICHTHEQCMQIFTCICTSLSRITNIVIMTAVSGICLHAKRLLFVAHLTSLHTQWKLLFYFDSFLTMIFLFVYVTFLSVSFSDEEPQLSQMG